MRIIGGKWKSFPLKSPEGPLTRPTSDELREAIFNILTSYFLKEGGSFEGLHVLDVFAGTGALGLEALSRGAESATFIERASSACRILRQNISFLKAESQCVLFQTDVLALKDLQSVFLRLPLIQQQKVKEAKEKGYNLVFLDAPYDQGGSEKALEHLSLGRWISKEGLLVVETQKLETLKVPDPFYVLDHRVRGKAALWILKLKA